MRVYWPLLTTLFLSPCLAQDFVEDFETGPGGAFSYHKAPDELTVERVQGQAASGQWHLRAALPGKMKLEGLALNAGGLQGGRLATVTAQVRGKGEIWLCLISGNGWLYSPNTLTLTDQWQEISLSKVLTATDQALGIYFITREVQPGAVFEVDHVRVATVPPAETWDASVGPWRVEADDFALIARQVTVDAKALGGEVVRGDQYVEVHELPTPRTSRPFTIYCRALSGESKDQWQLMTRQGGNIQYMRTVAPTQTGEWEWLEFAPVTAGELGEQFGVCSTRPANARNDVGLDSIVITTDADLTPEQLAAAPELLGARPLAAVGRGLPGSGAVISSFIGVGGTTAPQASTEVRLAYDDLNLHIQFVCPEPILDTAQQRRHEFLANVTQRDGEVYADDSVVVLLQPPGSNKVYDFTINALGTIADAVCMGADLWEGRDVSWNSGATARGEILEKSWRVELTIPWAALGGVPKPGDAWQASFGRLAKARKETSAWNLTNKGFHDPIQFGTLVFAETVPQVWLNPPAALTLKGNLLPPPSMDAATQARLRTSIELRTPMLLSHVYASSFDAPADPGLQVAYGVLDAASLQPLTLTPLLPQAVKSSLADLTVNSDGPFELLLNGQPLTTSASAADLAIQAPLVKGANVLTLQVQKGAATISGRIGEWQFGGPAWEVAAEGDKPAILKCTLLYEKTSLWPTPEPAYYFAQGVANHLTFRNDGLPGRSLDKWETYLAVPEGFEVVGSTGFYGNVPEVPRWTTTQLGAQTVLGKKMRVAKISADMPLVAGRHYIMSEFEALVRATDVRAASSREAIAENSRLEAARTDSEATPADCQFVYWSQANDGAVIEAPQTINVQLLPQVNGAQCKTLVWQLWGGWFSNMDDLKMREEILDCARAAGFNDIVGGDRWTSDNAPRFGIKHTLEVNFAGWSLSLAPYLKEHPDQRLVDAEGKTSDMYMCMTMLLGEGWTGVREALRDEIAEIAPHTIDYDYEYPPYTSHHSCYCDRCLAAFREFAKLAADQQLTPEIIRKQHGPQWVDFMARRVAKAYAKFRQTIHELSPGTLFSVYSGYALPDNAERYGVDWTLVGQEQGCDRAGCGYGRPMPGIPDTIKALNGIPLLIGALLTPYDREVLTPVTPLTKAWLSRAALDSTGGVLVYERCSMDGRSWVAMGETTRLVAKYEEAFLKGQHVPLGAMDSAQGEALQHGKTTLVFLMNPTAKATTLEAALPKEWGSGQGFYGGQKVTAGAPVAVPLAAGEAEVFVLSRGG